jgi:hypothetical protein
MAPSGKCPLPEPGRGAPHIEHQDHLKIKRQPRGYNYDRKTYKSEASRFNQQLQRLVDSGKITQREASRLME